MCPSCRQNAPLVYRGVNAFCTACGAPRFPLATSSVTLAGQPSRVGGTVARVFGWLVLGLGSATGLGIGAACSAILAPGAAAPYIIGVPIALLSVLVGMLLLRSGKKLKESGVSAAKATKLQAIFALANTRNGVLTAPDTARALEMSTADADAMLTAIAKEEPDRVTVDVSDEGVVLYRFPTVQWAAGNLAPNAPPPQARIATPPNNVRVDAPDPLVEQALDDAALQQQQRRAR